MIYLFVMSIYVLLGIMFASVISYYENNHSYVSSEKSEKYVFFIMNIGLWPISLFILFSSFVVAFIDHKLPFISSVFIKIFENFRGKKKCTDNALDHMDTHILSNENNEHKSINNDKEVYYELMSNDY